MNFSTKAKNLYSKVGVSFPIHHLKRSDVRKIVISSLKYLTNLMITASKNASGQAKAGKINFQFVLEKEYPKL
jgi:hypothetical protein